MASDHQKTECPDFDAMARFKALGPEVIEQIVRCFAKRLERFAAKRCSNKTLGEDALQDAMLNLTRGINTYRGEAPIELWLQKLVIGACSRLRRGRKNSRDNVSLNEGKGQIELQERKPDPEDLAIMKAELERVSEILRKLPLLNRQLLVLHDGEGRSIRELATQFKLTEDAVKSRLKRAYRYLREQQVIKLFVDK